MINILVDESHAFDYLAIFEVKHKIDPTNKEKELNFKKCRNYLKNQIKNNEFFESIMSSEEYKDCFETNYLTFQAVNDAKTDKVKASYVDKCNYRRFLIKQRIQKKFFNSKITETKIGYELYKDI